jgi:hypothetical protein
MHAIVSEARLLTNHRDGELALGIALAELLDEAMTHQTIPDDEHTLTTTCF